LEKNKTAAGKRKGGKDPLPRPIKKKGGVNCLEETTNLNPWFLRERDDLNRWGYPMTKHHEGKGAKLVFCLTRL